MSKTHGLAIANQLQFQKGSKNMKKVFNCSTCWNMQYELLNGMFFEEKVEAKEETKNYILCTSKLMDDYFWNMAYLKTKANENVLSEIENKLKAISRIPAIYIGRDDQYFDDNKRFLLDNGYKLNDTDVFMILNDYKETDININIKVVENESEYNDFMKVLASAYNDSIENLSENVYADAVTKCYYDAVRNQINSGKTFHIIGYNEDYIPVSVATLNIVDGVGGINNVGTAQGFWNRGYSKQVLTYLIKIFKENNGEHLLLCTEYHTKNQTYYEKLGFKEIYVMEQYMK